MGVNTNVTTISSQIHVVPATASDFEKIIEEAKVFDLDVEAPSFDQFVITKEKEKITGFARIIKHHDFNELATLGVIASEQGKGIGEAITRYLCLNNPGPLLLVTVIPVFFSKLGFKKISPYPIVLEKKVCFCKEFDFKDDEIFVMQYFKS